MANKYSNWNTSTNYKNTDYVKDNMHISTLTAQLFESKTTCIVSSKYVHFPNINTNVILNIKEIEIITRIASSKGLTFRQIKHYLQMQGYHINRALLNQYLYKLINAGIINVLFLNDVTQTNIYTNDTDPIYYYSLGRNGINIAKEFGIPLLSSNHNHVICKKYGTLDYTLSNILWNQIIINQLLYNNCLKHFHIQKVESSKKYGAVIIPLRICTKQNEYLFEYITESHLKTNYLQDILQQWFDYKQEKKKDFVLILACKNKTIMQKTYQKVNLYFNYNIPILYTYANDWFQAKSGNLYSWTSFNNQLATLTIDIL